MQPKVKDLSCVGFNLQSTRFTPLRKPVFHHSKSVIRGCAASLLGHRRIDLAQKSQLCIPVVPFESGAVVSLGKVPRKVSRSLDFLCMSLICVSLEFARDFVPSTSTKTHHLFTVNR